MAGSDAEPTPPGWLDRLFGVPPPPTDPPDGIPRLPGVSEPETLYLLLAAVLSIAVAVTLEWIISAAPVPPGGDPGQWIASSYPYIGRPAPSQVIFLGYPPLIFPLLGALVIVGGGPIAAGQLYIGVAAILLGLSTYVFARSMLRRPLIALLVAGFALLNFHLMLLFFFGGYPTVLGIVFLQLSLAAAARWMGSYRPRYLFLAWALLAATILTHSLVGLLGILTVATALLFLLAQRALPREVIFSKAGAAGLAVFVFSVGGYYVGTRFIGVSHPNYLEQNTLGQSKTNLNALLYPFHLSSLPGVFGHHAQFSAGAAYDLTIGFAVFLFFALAFLASQRRLPVSVLLQGSFILSVLAAGLAGWSFSIVTDYRRFAYFLYIPITLAVAWIFDYLLGVFLSTGEQEAEAPGLPPLPPRVPRRGPNPLTVAIAVVGVAAMAFTGVFTAVPAWQNFETQFTGAPHSADYLTAIGAINHAGLSGSIVTDSVPADRWTRALTDRNTYAPASPTSFVFYGSQILDDEKAIFALSYLYGVTDGKTLAAVASANATYFNATPAYIAYDLGVPIPVLRIIPSSLVVSTLSNETVGIPAYTGAVPPVFRFVTPGQPVLSISFQTRAYTLTELIAPHLPADGFTISLTATAIGTAQLHRFSGQIGLPNPGVIGGPNISVYKGGGFKWPSAGPIGLQGLSTIVQLAGSQPAGSNATQKLQTTPGGLAFSVSAGPVNSSAASSLSVSISLATPDASNLVDTLPPILSTPSILQGWSARYLLLDQFPGPIPRYYVHEFGAQPLAVLPLWSVYTLSLVYPSDPY